MTYLIWQIDKLKSLTEEKNGIPQKLVIKNENNNTKKTKVKRKVETAKHINSFFVNLGNKEVHKENFLLIRQAVFKSGELLYQGRYDTFFEFEWT